MLIGTDDLQLAGSGVALPEAAMSPAGPSSLPKASTPDMSAKKTYQYKLVLLGKHTKVKIV